MIKALIAKLRKKQVKKIKGEPYQSTWGVKARSIVTDAARIADQFGAVMVDSPTDGQYAPRRLVSYVENNQQMFSIPGASMQTTSTADPDFQADIRIDKKPVEVFEEILKEVPVFEVTESVLDAHIKIVEERIKILSEHIRDSSFSDEYQAIAFLKARKSFWANRDLFKWKTTTEDMIKALLKKYKLTMRNIEGYHRNLPKEAVDEIAKFTKAFRLVVKDGDPLFEMIMDKDGPETKKDPILLARSPFGRWYYVLGAWDLEVLIVDELVYGKPVYPEKAAGYPER